MNKDGLVEDGFSSDACSQCALYRDSSFHASDRGFRCVEACVGFSVLATGGASPASALGARAARGGRDLDTIAIPIAKPAFGSAACCCYVA